MTCPVAYADLASRRQGQPRREVLGCWPLVQICPAFGDQAQRQVESDAMNLRQINTREFMKGLACIKAYRIGLHSFVPRLV